jgi:DNA-binding IclR family transcriptional regulator
MKSLKKAFDLLEYVVAQGGVPVTPTACAEATGWNAVTCTRILGELTELGYLEKVTRKSGYRPGPMCSALSLRNNVYSRLSKASEGPLHRFALTIGAIVNFSVFHPCGRVMIRICGGGEGVHHIWKDFRFPLSDGMPTSQLLLAAMGKKQRQAYCPEALHGELDHLAEKGFFRGKEGDLTVQGHLILCEDYPPAAFGYGVRQGLDPDEIARLGAETAREIITILHTQRTIF